MATKVDYTTLAAQTINEIGGPDNIRSVSHCATRLRVKVVDSTKVNDSALENIPDVLALVKAGGQHQIVIGNDVPLLYDAVISQPNMSAKGVKTGAVNDTEEAETDKNLFNRFIDMISSIFSPILWCLAGIALFKAFLSMGLQLNWLTEDSQTYTIWYAAADAMFYFLPLFLAVTSARKFKVNEFVAMAVVAPLVYPAIVSLADANSVHFFGIPVVTMNYTSSVIPAIVAVWVTGYLQRWLEKILPGAIRNFGVPLICVIIMVPLVLLTVGPLTMVLANGISSGVLWIFSMAPWLAGAIMGAFWQVLVIFGLHWGLIPVFLNDIANQGSSLMMAPLMAAVLAQGAAVLAVALRTKDAKRRKLAGPAAVSGLVAGVTEPAIYGVNLPLKIPFYAGCVGGGIGGAIIGAGGSAFTAFVFPSLLAIPAVMHIGNFILLLIGSVVGMIIGFVGTFVYLPKLEAAESAGAEEPVETEESASTSAAAVAPENPTVGVLIPVEGTVVPLDQVPDKVFAAGVMGTSIAVQPNSGEFFAPVSGTVIAAPKSGHAYGIKTDSGVEVLVHVGLDTVKLEGAGFTPHVQLKDHVQAGDPLVTADLDAITAAGYPTTTILVVSNSAKLTDTRVAAQPGPVIKGEVGILATK